MNNEEECEIFHNTNLGFHMHKHTCVYLFLANFPEQCNSCVMEILVTLVVFKVLDKSQMWDNRRKIHQQVATANCFLVF